MFYIEQHSNILHIFIGRVKYKLIYSWNIGQDTGYTREFFLFLRYRLSSYFTITKNKSIVYKHNIIYHYIILKSGFYVVF